MKRTAEVEITTTITVEFDDAVPSEWDGRTLLHRHENPEAWEPGTTLRDVIAGMAVSIGLWNSHDGWADFPDGTIAARLDWANSPNIGKVTLDGKALI